MNIDISMISLDIKNYRHREASTDREAMQLLLTDEKTHKVSELASDIVEMGLDPSTSLIVTEDDANPGKYIALEGNRRITALKTLISPEIAAGLPSYSTFKRLSAKFLTQKIDQVECVVLDRKTAFEWIKRKHNKAIGGKGVVEWSAVATARSDASEGRYARWLTALNFLELHKKPTDALFEGIANKVTTVDRVLSSPNIRSVLGLAFNKSGTVSPDNGNIQAACTLLISLLGKMGEPDFTETKVTSAELQKDFINKFADLNVRKPVTDSANSSAHASGNQEPLKTTDGNNTTSGKANRGGGGGGGVAGQTNPPNPVKPPSLKAKPANQRKTLAAPGLRINNSGLNKLYLELRKINVENNPYVGSAVLRIFLEKATMVFLDDMNIVCPNPRGWHDSTNKLRTKVKHALDVVDAAKTDRQLVYAWDIANATTDKTHTLDYLNDAIHNHLAIPSALEILTAWDRLHPYYSKLFEHLENHGK